MLFLVSGALVVLGLPIVAMAALFGALMALPLARRFYEIEPIKFADAVFLGLISVAWSLIVFLARRSGFVDRLDDRVAAMTARRGAAEAPRKAA